MRELIDLHGHVDMNKAAALSQDPKSLTASVFEQVKNPPNQL